MGDKIPTGMAPPSSSSLAGIRTTNRDATPRTSPAGVGNTHLDMTPWTSPAGVGTPRGNIIQEFLKTLDQGRVPTPIPDVLLSEMGLNPSGLSPSPTGLTTNTLLSQ